MKGFGTRLLCFYVEMYSKKFNMIVEMAIVRICGRRRIINKSEHVKGTRGKGINTKQEKAPELFFLFFFSTGATDYLKGKKEGAVLYVRNRVGSMFCCAYTFTVAAAVVPLPRVVGLSFFSALSAWRFGYTARSNEGEQVCVVDDKANHDNRKGNEIQPVQMCTKQLDRKENGPKIGCQKGQVHHNGTALCEESRHENVERRHAHHKPTDVPQDARVCTRRRLFVCVSETNK